METLQRIYGISFPDPKMLKEWEKFQEEAKNRDHRKLGRVKEVKGNNEDLLFVCFQNGVRDTLAVAFVQRRTLFLNNTVFYGDISYIFSMSLQA